MQLLYNSLRRLALTADRTISEIELPLETSQAARDFFFFSLSLFLLSSLFSFFQVTPGEHRWYISFQTRPSRVFLPPRFSFLSFFFFPFPRRTKARKRFIEWRKSKDFLFFLTANLFIYYSSNICAYLQQTVFEFLCYVSYKLPVKVQSLLIAKFRCRIL